MRGFPRRNVMWIFVVAMHYLVVSAMTIKFSHARLQQLMEQGMLTNPRSDMYVLGTVHLGGQSAEDVRQLLEVVRPDCVVLEVSPSRLQRIQQKDKTEATRRDGPKNNVVSSILALTDRGLEIGGLSGALFAMLILGGTLLKQARQTEKLVREDEFGAAVYAADSIDAKIIAADWELDELLERVSRLSPLYWMQLGGRGVLEDLNIVPADPIRRGATEGLVDWEVRRRNIATARASRCHGEETAADLSRILVDERNQRFSEFCIEDKEGATTVCIVGLVHVDGVSELLSAVA